MNVKNNIGISEQIIGLTEPYPLEELDTVAQSIFHRPWGYYNDLFRSGSYVLKTIVVRPQKRLSLQYHNHRQEIWLIRSGIGSIYQEIPGKDQQGRGVEMAAYPGDVFQIGVGDIHRVKNIGDDDLIIVELQIGKCSEEDIVRIEDDWGRE